MAAKKKTDTKKDLEKKIAALEVKLSKLSEKLDPPSVATPKPKKAPKPAETKPAEVKPAETAKPKPTLPKGSTPKPQEAPKPAETKSTAPTTARCIRKCIHECSND